MDKQMNADAYYVRPGQFSLVELSLLSRLFVEFGPKNRFQNVSEVLLAMKSCESKPECLVVLFCIDTPVAFRWDYQGEQFLCFHTDHQSARIQEFLLKH